MFDSNKRGSIEKEKVKTILRTLGASYDDRDLDAQLKSEDPEGMCEMSIIISAPFSFNKKNRKLLFPFSGFLFLT